MPYGEVPQDNMPRDFLTQQPATFSYYNWDKSKTRGCVCDPQWGDVDCSKRVCDYGNDIMDRREDLTESEKFQVQKLYLEADSTDSLNSLHDKTFALTFKSQVNETFTTAPIKFFSSSDDFHDFILDVQSALKALPNKVIDDVRVSGTYEQLGNSAWINISFVGENVQGPQNLVTVRAYKCGDGCTPKIDGMVFRPTTQVINETQASNFNSFECGRRGKCDYTTGICNCFAGYTGPTCGTITALV